MRVHRGKHPTHLAAWRILSGKTQREMAEATGISLSTYRRLERGEIDNPPLRYLANCAIVMDTDIASITEPEWTQWYVFDKAASEPPDPDVFLATRFYDLDDE